MKEVREKIYFHYQSQPEFYWEGVGVKPWQTGTTFVVGRQFNPYFDYFNRYRARTSGVINGKSVVEQMKNGHSGDLNELVGLAIDQLESNVRLLREECQLVRELLFEEVRRNHFPTFPSRQRCIWVAPSVDGVRYWRDRVPGDKRWFRVRLTGKIHTASDAYLTADTMSLDVLRELAWKYWSGYRGEREDRDEILFEGVVEVIEELSIEDLLSCDHSP